MVILVVPVNRLASEIIFFAGNLIPKNFGLDWRRSSASWPPWHGIRQLVISGGSIRTRLNEALIEPSALIFDFRCFLSEIAYPQSEIGGPTRIRTWDQGIMSPLL